MWPKVLAQLIEFLPHATRLVPMADRFLQQRSHADTATTEAIESLRADAGASSAQLRRDLATALEAMSAQTSTLAADVRAVRSAVEELERRSKQAESLARTQSKLLGLTIVLLLVVLGCIVFLLLHR